MDANPISRPRLGQMSQDREKIYQWIADLCNSETRENALSELSIRRDNVHDLGPMLWHATGVITGLLFEIVSTYQYVNPSTMTSPQVTRLCNALALMQCVGVHPSTRSEFLKAQIPHYIYPFLKNSYTCHNSSQLKVASLNVIVALVETGVQEVITFLITTDVIPLCLCIMETGFELTKTLSTFILYKILMNDNGLSYICHCYETFSNVVGILRKMVFELEREPSTKLFGHIVRCYLRLSENFRAREALKTCLPLQFQNPSALAGYLAGEPTIAASLLLLKNNLK